MSARQRLSVDWPRAIAARIVGWAKRKRAHQRPQARTVGTAQARLCPPYEATTVIASEAKQSIFLCAAAMDCFAGARNDGTKFGATSLTDLPVGSFRKLASGRLSSPRAKNISVFPKCKSGVYLTPSRLAGGALRIVTNVEAGCGGRGRCRKTGGASRGRRSRVV